MANKWILHNIMKPMITLHYSNISGRVYMKTTVNLLLHIIILWTPFISEKSGKVIIDYIGRDVFIDIQRH